MQDPQGANEVVDHETAAKLLAELWKMVSADSADRQVSYLEDPLLTAAVRDSLNHGMVSYRFCLPTQLLGKAANPAIDCLCMQRRTDQPDKSTGWDARSLASKVVARFNASIENVLGPPSDPYVNNPLRVPRIKRDDKSKKDVAGWNRIVDVLESVEHKNDPAYTESVLKQVLLEMFQRLQRQKFSYPVPPRISLHATLKLCEDFLSVKSGGDRALALTGALFESIAIHFGIFSEVNRARINASDQATGMSADLECLDAEGQVALTVEVKDRRLSLTDLESTLQKSRQNGIRDILFTAKKVAAADESSIRTRVAEAFTSGQNLYVFEFPDLARSVLALGGESIRRTFLETVGQQLDEWSSNPLHRQAWQELLKKL